MAEIDSIIMPNGEELTFSPPPENTFMAEYGTTTYEAIQQAITENKAVFCIKNGFTYCYSEYGEDGEFLFWLSNNARAYRVECWQDSSWHSFDSPLYTQPITQVASNQNYYLTVARQNTYISRSTISFGSSTTQYLANNGTWQNIPTVPTAVSQLTNDSGYLTLATLPIWDGSVTP